MVKIQPFGDRILVKVINEEEVVVGGLIMAPTPKELSNRGIVEALGDGENLSCVEVGSKVLFQVGAGLNYATDKGDYKILNIKDVLGKIVEGE